jgi:hypothetical protein
MSEYSYGICPLLEHQKSAFRIPAIGLYGDFSRGRSDDEELHFETPPSFGARIPLMRTGSALGPLGGLPPSYLPAGAVRDDFAHPVATFIFEPSRRPPAMSFSREKESPPSGGHLAMLSR